MQETVARLRAAGFEVWNSCYDSNWNGLITPESFSHPAKMAHGLTERIFDYAIARGWIVPGESVVVDPFGGIGSTGIVGASRGVKVLCCELEQKFVDLAKQNFELHRRTWEACGDPLPVIVQGDSRRLCEVLGPALADCVVEQPLEDATMNLDAQHTQAIQGPDGANDSSLGVPPYGPLFSLEDTRENEVFRCGVSAHSLRGGGKSSLDCETAGRRPTDGFKDNDEEWDSSKNPIGCTQTRIQDRKKASGYPGRRETRELQARQEQCPVSLDDYQGQVPEVRDDGEPGDSPQERRPLRQPAEEPGSALQLLPHERDEAEVVGCEEGRVANAKEQRAVPLESQAACIISSPPFLDSLASGETAADMKARWPDAKLGGSWGQSYGSSDGNLAAMPTGNVDSIISSPPYSSSNQQYSETDGCRKRLQDAGEPTSGCGLMRSKHSMTDGYGTDPGNLGNLPAGDVADAIVSSPPFMSQSNRGAADPTFAHKFNGEQRYSDESPVDPRKTVGGDRNSDAVKAEREQRARDIANLGEIVVDSGATGLQHTETFWSAAREIVQQCFQILRPGGVAIWVCKDFVRKGQRVPFSADWQRLCIACGFEPVEWIKASLVKEQRHPGLFGDEIVERTERKGFFRRLAEKKGSPKIDEEDVLILRKPSRPRSGKGS